ncbi:MAG: hypothetical protein GQ574_18730 [Crocinitomix sp.]|nr:hypothetical protein [Crocinitomix sp.]
MSYITDHKQKFDNLKVSLEQTNKEHLKRKANGGNSIVFTYPPSEEVLYIEKAKELFDKERFAFINVADLLVKFIDMDSWSDFESYYKDFADTPHLVFKSKDDATDLMDLIIQEVSDAASKNLIPILIRTGVLFGTGIENVNIMEDKTVMGLNQPLIIFYPAKLENDNLYFLNFKLASKYRCTVIE